MKQPRGRPPLPKSKRRPNRVGVRLSDTELAFVSAKAEAEDKKVSAYLREKGLAS